MPDMEKRKEKQIIVIVDDNPVTLKAGRDIIKNDYNAFVVPSGEKLFTLLLSVKPDLILLDIKMPGMNGYEVIKELKSRDDTRDIPVIFITSLNDAENELEGLNLGAIDYLLKPFSAPLLLKRLGTHLRMLSQTQTLKKVNEELLQAKEQAEAASKAKSFFLAQISHEIRTPMNVIGGMAELMREDNLDEVQKGYLRDIRDMSGSLLQIINDILDLSKIESGKMDVFPVHFSLADTYTHLCSTYSCLARNKELEFRSFLDGELPKVIYGDEIRIRQIITNVLGNAIKYTHQGFVELRIGKTIRNGSDWLVVSVADSGIGIKEEDRSKIFSNFQQVDQEKNRSIQGTGLGLSITQELVLLMGGSIEFESEYEKGSIFTIYLPLIFGDKGKIERNTLFERVLAKGNVSVLVVDDNPVNLTVALGFLLTHNIKAKTASSGPEALGILWEQARLSHEEPVFDLIFMDHKMPDMDGIEVTRHIRKWEEKTRQKKPIPIVALTANAVTGTDKIFFEAGMNDFISKPIIANQLNTVLKQWLPPGKISAGAGEESKEKSPLKDQMELLREACKLCSTDEAERIAAVLPQYAGSSEMAAALEKIQKIIKSYEYEKALNEIDVLLKSLDRG